MIQAGLHHTAHMDLLLKLLLAGLGGVGSAYLNDRFTDPNGVLRPRQVGPIVLTPGAQVSLGVIALMMFVPKAVPVAGALRTGLGTMAIGGATVEGAKVLGDEILPVLKGQKAPAPQLPAAQPAVAGWPMWGARVGFQPTSQDVTQQLLGLHSFAAAGLS